MAENPHPSLPATKLVSQEALLRYHHTLIEKLGLVQDTAAYKYGQNGGTRTGEGGKIDDPFDATNVGEALDKLYDMAKEGALTFASGKSEDATLEDVEFDTEDGEDSNLYWIHAQVGDDIVNIKLNADAFIKDSVLDSVVLVNLSTVEGEKIYKVGGTEAGYSTETIAGKEVPVLTVGENKYYGFSEENDGTYFHYTWRIDEGEKGVGYTFTTISLKDVYGDIHDDGKGYIHYDKETAKIAVDTAEAVGVETIEVPASDEVKVALETAGIDFAESEDGSTLIIKETPLDTVKAALDGVIPTDGITSKTVWEVQNAPEDDQTPGTNLATTENLTNVAQNLQYQIDELENKNELKDGEVSFSTEATSMTAQVSEEGSYYKLNLQIMSNDEVDGLFSVCSTASTAAELADLGEDANVNVAAENANEVFKVESKEAVNTVKTFNQINIG